MAGNFKAIQARLFEPKPRSHRTGFPATPKRVASLMLSAFLFKPPRACMTTTSTKVAIRETSARFYTDTIWRLVPHVVVPTRPCGAKIGCTCAELPSNARGVTATRWYAGSSSQVRFPKASRRFSGDFPKVSRGFPESAPKVSRKSPVSFVELLQADVRADVVAKSAAGPPQNSQMPSDASGGYIRSKYAASTRQVRSECVAGQRVRGRYAAGTRKYPAHMLLLLLFMFRIVPEIS